MEARLLRKVAVVTAATKGIGFGIAKALASLDASVAICARTAEDVEEATERLGALGEGSVIGVAADIGSAAEIESFLSAVRRDLGPVEILVNNNGGPPSGPALSFGDDEWRSALDRNLLSTVRFTRLVADDMKAKRWGRIVNLTSTTAKEPEVGMVLSNVTRAAVAAYGKTMSRELGPFGITVNTILTGGVLTDRLRHLVAAEVGPDEVAIEEAIAAAAESIPVGYIATPDEFAKTVLFLVSEESSYLNGAAIALDGGATGSIF